MRGSVPEVFTLPSKDFAAHETGTLYKTSEAFMYFHLPSLDHP